jgi:hypothetical protein
MITVREYILLSVLSYCNFSENECKKTLKEIFEATKNTHIITGTFDVLLPQNRKLFLDYFGDVLGEWKIYHIDNRTAHILGKNASGFYSVVFEKNGEFVIAYRGSEKFPLEDAYKDFIETDLAIGLGKIPLQFYEGVEVYYNLVNKHKILSKNISLTGHSLGGGIAQYVALSVDKNSQTIPYTYTWNAVGINRDGIVSVLDYIDLEKILKEQTDLTVEERNIFLPFKQPYLEFLSKELKKIKAIKDTRTTLVDKYDTVFFDIDESFIKQLLKTTNLEKCMMKLPLPRRKSLILKQHFFDKIFQLTNMGELLEKAQGFIERVRNNKVYEEYIFNFGHSQDLTFSLFKHLGASYLVDENFSKRNSVKSSFFNNFKIFTKSIQDHHFEDVFLPFIVTYGENKGNFAMDLSLDFMASSLRKLFTMEYCLEKRLLANYYSLVTIDETNFEEIKKDIISGLSSSGVNMLYRKQMINQIREMEKIEFNILWEKVKKKLPSPYKNLDIFDIFIFSE